MPVYTHRLIFSINRKYAWHLTCGWWSFDCELPLLLFLAQLLTCYNFPGCIFSSIMLRFRMFMVLTHYVSSLKIKSIFFNVCVNKITKATIWICIVYLKIFLQGDWRRYIWNCRGIKVTLGNRWFSYKSPVTITRAGCQFYLVLMFRCKLRECVHYTASVFYF